ncbi:MAG: hypothetical protein M3548_21870 [Actinomycetota bacterium]|nr:hypothetical protein [Actinomycetota bacterium]
MSRFSVGKVRKRCAAMLDSLRLPQPFSASALCAAIAEQRGRPLYVHPIDAHEDSGGLPCGMWVATDIADHIFVEQHTSAFHQDHIILHELAHMLFEHSVVDLYDEPEQVVVDGEVDPSAVRQVLLRTSYTTEQEQEAELLASLITAAAAARLDAPASGTLGALETAMGYKRWHEG